MRGAGCCLEDEILTFKYILADPHSAGSASGECGGYHSKNSEVAFAIKQGQARLPAADSNPLSVRPHVKKVHSPCSQDFPWKDVIRKDAAHGAKPKT